jgi:23S rRNA (adenine2503-C2)-methyltransferase
MQSLIAGTKKVKALARLYDIGLVAMDFKDLTLKELTTVVATLGKPQYTAKNLFRWVYKKRVEDYALMSDVAKELREHLVENYKMVLPGIVSTEKSSDGTVKFLLKLNDGETIESVLIPKEDRTTICVSTQVGCKMGCTFCCTATQGFTRSLATSEIVNQVVVVNDYAREKLGYEVDDSGVRAISNIVFMGMGEPFDNLYAVVNAVDILSDHNGLAFGMRKITVSTCGLVPMIPEFKKRCGAKLAISLNAADDKLRSELMPINKSYPIKTIIDAIIRLPLKSLEFITIEYIMFGGLNDTEQDAERLAKLLKAKPVKVNLIPFNPYSNASKFKRPSDKAMHDFYDYLAKKGVICNVRHSRGSDISAACGQLKSKKV